MLRLNNQGGTIPSNEAERERAKGSDLITFPVGITCVTCGNCSFIRGLNKDGIGMCVHPEVNQPVTVLQCCNFWSAPGIRRDF